MLNTLNSLMVFSYKQIVVSALLCLSLVGCVSKASVKPIDSQASASKLFAKDPKSDAFNQYLIQHGYPKESLPLSTWDIDTLTLCALFYHTDLAVDKEQLALAELAIATAGTKPFSTINGALARSNQANGDIRPWSYGLTIDIPLTTHNKREIRIEKAVQHAEVIRMQVAETAWRLRNQISSNLIAYHQNMADSALLKEQVELQQRIVNMYEQRVKAGIASRTEFNTANLLLLKAKNQQRLKQSQLAEIKATIASDVGLTPSKFESIAIKPLDVYNSITQQAAVLDASKQSKALQEQALLNRIDIRRSLARYALAETAIKLQAAEQMPDITISPGFLFEYGDKIWSLGFSRLLDLFHKNTTLIAEAKQLREIEGAQFEALQASTIAQINQLQARYFSAKEAEKQATVELDQQIKQTQKVHQQFERGLIGKLDFTQHSLNTIIAKQHQLSAQFNLLLIANLIEDAMQKPIFSSFNMPITSDTRSSYAR